MNAAKGTEYAIVNAVLTWIDYFLLNPEEFDLENLGLAGITSDTFKGSLAEITRTAKKEINVYNWEQTLLTHINKSKKLIKNCEIDDTLLNHPLLKVIDTTMISNYPKLSPREITEMRAWLQINGYYQISKTFRYSINSASLVKILYPNTLRGQTLKSVIEVLCAGPYKSKGREFNAVQTTRKGTTNSCESLSKRTYMSAFGSLAALQSEFRNFLPLPDVIQLSAIDQPGRSSSRFQTVPASIVFHSLRTSIEFLLEFDKSLVNSYISLLERSKKINKSLLYFSTQEFAECLDQKVIELGVTNWIGVERERDAKKRYVAKSADMHTRVEKLTGLHYCLQVLYGSALIIIGTLMARRQDELTSLIANSALDKTSKYLIVEVAKSSRMLYGIRATHARPIAKIAAEAIANLERIQEALIHAKYIPSWTNVFAPPLVNSPARLAKANHGVLNGSLDALCDYAETRTKDGRRYYLRQHQLRRFFCMVFFWHRSFAGLDCLRWFLGHQDVEHVYRYITESTPGHVLTAIKAQHVGENIDSYANLTEYLKKRFGSDIFSLLDSHDLEMHIANLIEDGVVTVEPHFFQTTSGKDYQILVVVK